MRKAGSLTIQAATWSVFFITIMMMSTGKDVMMSMRPGLVKPPLHAYSEKMNVHLFGAR